MREVGILVPNLFLYATVETAVRSLGLRPVRVTADDDPLPPVVIVDVGAVALEQALELSRRGVQVLAFGPHTESRQWAPLRAAGAVVLAKSRFFQELPGLLEKAIGPLV